MGTPRDIQGFEAEARRRLDPAVWTYLSRGAEAGLTLADNTAAWERLRLRPRILRGVQTSDTSVVVMGDRLALPVLTAPTGRATRFHPLGEVEVLAGVARAGSLAVLPSSVAASLDRLAAFSPSAPRWVQLYFDRDRGRMTEALSRARGAGCRAVVLTVDLVPDPKGPSAPPQPPPAPWEAPPDDRARPLYAGVGMDDLAWLTGLNILPVIVKGVLRADDAKACVDAGAQGLVVSNHGGGQLDGAISTAEALEPIVAAVGGRAEIYVDGGIRRGSSVLKALALGARAVLIGRPTSFGLATDGASGVSDVLDVLRGELERAMALCGANTLADIDRSLVV